MKYIKQLDGISYDVYDLEMIIAIAFKICSKGDPFVQAVRNR